MSAYLAELSSYLTRAGAKLLGARNFPGAMHLNVAADIAADAIRDHHALAALAHRAETHDREAERLITAAQLPASDGGAAITPREMRPIRALIHRSAEEDHDLAERTTVPAA